MALLKSKRRLFLLGGVVFLFLVIVAWLFQSTWIEPIDSYGSCVQAGYPVAESNPPVCQVGERTFIGPIGTPESTTAPVTTIPFDLLVDADSHGGYPRKLEVITTQAEWESYWAQIHAGVSPLPPIIHVDFATSDVIALSDGTKGTSGYRITVSSIVTARTGSIVRVTDTSPVGCIETESLSNPYYIVQTSKLQAPVSFTVTPAEHHCK